jgi:hypothetical protein
MTLMTTLALYSPHTLYFLHAAMYLICLELSDERAVQVKGHSHDIFPAVHQDLPGNRKETYFKTRTQEML